jgi:thioredoxin 2
MSNTLTTFTLCGNCNQVNRVPFDLPEQKEPICGKCKSRLSFHNGVSDLSASAAGLLAQKSPLPVVLDFWAPWCQPCRVFAPTFLKAASLLVGKAVLAKVDTEAHPLASSAYKIRGIPTLVILKNGVELGRQSGALPLESFLSWIGSVTQVHKAA